MRIMFKKAPETEVWTALKLTICGADDDKDRAYKALDTYMELHNLDQVYDLMVGLDSEFKKIYELFEISNHKGRTIIVVPK